MTRTFTSPRRAVLDRLRSMARSAAGLACCALVDVGEVLVQSLLTARAAAAAACAFVLWIAKALLAVVTRGLAHIPALAHLRRDGRPLTPKT